MKPEFIARPKEWVGKKTARLAATMLRITERPRAFVNVHTERPRKWAWSHRERATQIGVLAAMAVSNVVVGGILYERDREHTATEELLGQLILGQAYEDIQQKDENDNLNRQIQMLKERQSLADQWADIQLYATCLVTKAVDQGSDLHKNEEANGQFCTDLVNIMRAQRLRILEQPDQTPQGE